MRIMPLSVTHLLTQDQDVPVEVRGALAEGRLEDAGRMLMEQFELSCEEASSLVAAPVCDDCIQL
jgi:hypothetical protein